MTELEPGNKLAHAYNEMMRVIRDAFDSADEDTSDISLQHALQQACDRVVELGELTAEEASEVSEYIKRDVNDAAEYLMESSAEFSDWLLLDIEVVERKIIDLFLSVADNTRLELELLQQRHREQATYHSGEVTGPGTLECTRCNNHIAYATTGVIFKCAECGNNAFVRATVRRLPEE